MVEFDERTVELIMSELIEAAKAVVDRWDSPDWSDGTHTSEYINRLRKALSSQPVRKRLTDDAIRECSMYAWDSCSGEDRNDYDLVFARAIEAKINRR